MRNLSLTSPSTMSNSNALLSSSPSLVLRAPRNKAKATKVGSSFPVTPAQDVAKINRSRALALEALKRGKSWGYYSNAVFSALKVRLNSATDFLTVDTLYEEVLNKNIHGSKLNCLKISLESKRNMKRIIRVCQWKRDRNWYVARALVMMKDAVKYGNGDIKQFKENLKLCLTSCGSVHCSNIDMDLILKYTDEMKYGLRSAGHPAYQNGKARRKHIRSCIFNRYYATPIIP